MILAIAAGLVIGLALGSLGGGGSILAVPVLAHLAGQSASGATATSLVAVGAAAAVGALGHARAGRVRWKPAAAFVATGIAGSWAGSTLGGRLDGDVLLLAFSGLVLVAAHRMLTACPSCTNVGEALATATATATATDTPPAGGARGVAPLGRAGSRRSATSTAPAATLAAPGTSGSAVPSGERAVRVLPIVLAGTAVGFLTGLFGVGGGFVIVPALTLALGLSMPVAIGTSLVVIVGNAVVALGIRGLGAVDWELALPFTATMLVGSLVGSLVSHRLPPVRSLHAFAALLVVVAVANGALAATALAA